MAVNKATGEVYHTGSPLGNYGTLDFGNGVTLPLGNVRCAPLVKYSTNLLAQWAVEMAMPFTNGWNQYGTCVAVDPSGNPYAGGTFASYIDLGAGEVPAVGGQDGFIAGYDAATGAFIPGSDRIIASNSTGNEQVTSLAIDTTGIYVTGHWAGAAGQTMSLGAPLGNMTASSFTQGFVGRYTLANVPVWQRALTGSSYNLVACGAVSSTDFFVSGHYSDTTSNWGYGAVPSISTAADIILAKYEKLTGALTGYSRVWGTTSVFEYGSGIAVLPGGDPVMTGQWGGTSTVVDWDPGPGTHYRTSAGGGDIYAVRLASGPGAFY